MAKKLSLLMLLLLLAWPCRAFPEDAAPAAPAENPDWGWHGGTWQPTDFIPPQHLTLDPGLSVYAGYRFTGLNGSTRAALYDYLHDSFAGGLSLHYYPLPSRYDVDVDYKNQYDYNAEAGAAFADIFRLDVRSTALFHNLDHFVLITTPDAVDSDPGRNYGVKIHDDEVGFVIKSPNRPYHLYMNYREFRKNGTIQQRFTLNLDDNDATSSRSRDIDWVTRELTVGTNADVMGLFELDYHHTFKTFDAHADRVLGPDVYADADPSLVSNNLLHNLVPDFTSNYNTFGLHTNLSKPLNASGTFTWGDKKNEASGAKVDFHREYGDVTYRPLDNLLMSVKYGHQRLEVKNPDSLIALDSNTTPALTPVDRKSMSTTRDRGIFAVQYYPVPKLMFLGQYELDAVERTGVDQWNDVFAADTVNLNKGSSTTHKGSVSASFAPERHTSLRAGFSYAFNEDPSYIVDFKNQYEGFVWGTWVPAPGLTFNGQYKLLRSNNPDRTDGDNLAPFVEPRRHVSKDNAGAGVTWIPARDLVVGAHYDYLRLKVVQDLYYLDASIPAITVVSPAVPYRDYTHEYSIFANYCFSFPLTVEATFSQSWSKGAYRLDEALTSPIGGLALTDGLAALTDQSVRETRGLIKADYKFYKGWGASLAYGISAFSDLEPRAYTGVRTGVANFGTVLLTKNW